MISISLHLNEGHFAVSTLPEVKSLRIQIKDEQSYPSATIFVDSLERLHLIEVALTTPIIGEVQDAQEHSSS